MYYWQHLQNSKIDNNEYEYYIIHIMTFLLTFHSQSVSDQSKQRHKPQPHVASVVSED